MTAGGPHVRFPRPARDCRGGVPGFTRAPLGLGFLISNGSPHKGGRCRRIPVKRTYQPHRKSRLRSHGFRARMATADGRKIINARRAKGRKRLIP